MLIKSRETVEKIFNETISFYRLGVMVDKARLTKIESNPYHNDYHTKCVVVNCVEGASFSNMTYDATYDLLVAALFHDSMHSGGYENDSVNIKNAIQNLTGFDHSISYDKIARFIASTEYPFKESVVPYPIEIEILRDADLMQSLMPEWETMYRGLQLEVSYQQRKMISDKDWKDGTTNFYNDATLFTQWAISKIKYCRSLGTVQSKNIHHGWMDVNVNNSFINVGDSK